MPPLTSLRIAGARSAVIHPRPAGRTSSRMRASVSSPPVADQDDARQGEAFAQLLQLGGQRAGIGGVALEDLRGDRAALAVAQQREDDLELAALAVAGVAALGQRTLRALEVDRGDVAEHQGALFEVPGRQVALDAGLALEQPVHGAVELVLAGVLDAEFLAQRVGQGLAGQGAGGGQLGAGIQDAGEDHGGGQGPVARGAAVQELLEAEAAGGSQHGGGVAVGPGAEDGEGVAEGGQRHPALEQDAEPLDQIVGPLRQVGEGAFLDLAVFAEGLAQQHGGRGAPVGHAFDIHGYHNNYYNELWQVDISFATWVRQTPRQSRQTPACQ